MKNKFIQFFLIFLFLSNCGFKVVNNELNYTLNQIKLTGDKRINYLFKNKILNNSKKNSENLINLSINTKKYKYIKEKNIKNEITKYEISIVAILNYENITNDKVKQITLSKQGDYNVASKMSDNINNEKNLIKLLTNSLSEQIIETIVENQ